MRRHFDGRGHIIGDYFEMERRFSGDTRSLSVLRHFAPFRYVCVPDVEIHVKKGQVEALEVVLVYPGEVKRLCKQMSSQALLALRRLYKSGDTSWRVAENDHEVVFRRKGQLMENKSSTNYLDGK